MSTKLSLKLLINSTTNKVLFAEAGKDVVDFLFGLLELPVGSIVKIILSNQTMMLGGSLANLYKSIEALDQTYLQSKQAKDTLLDPLSKNTLSHTTLLLPSSDASNFNKKFYKCAGNHNHVSDVYGIICPQCNHQMKTAVSYVCAIGTENAGENGIDNINNSLGFVKGVVTYSIMDDLTITPMSTISGIALLTKFNVKDVGVLKEKIVDIGFDEGLAMLKVSFQSKNVLSEVFLKSVK